MQVLDENLIETLTIDSTSANEVYSGQNLIQGKRYRIEASGFWNPAVWHPNGWFVDAKYVTIDEWH